MEPDLRYPIGRFEPVMSLTPDQRRSAIDAIAEAPERLISAVTGLTPAQLDTAYRPGGWTVRQLVHHLPDSHLNSYLRFKLAVTEHEPTIQSYEEALWAELADAKTAPIAPSLALLENLPTRWVMFLRSLGSSDWARVFHHPEWGRVTLDFALAQYSWQGKHHVAYITALREREGWH